MALDPKDRPLSGQFGWVNLGGGDHKTRPVFLIRDRVADTVLLLAPSSTTDLAGLPRAGDRPFLLIAANDRWGRRLALRKNCRLYAKSLLAVPVDMAIEFVDPPKTLPFELALMIANFAEANAGHIWAQLGWGLAPPDLDENPKPKA